MRNRGLEWQRVLPAILAGAVLVSSPVSHADVPDAGTRAWLQCRACHSLKADEPDKVGPNLHGMFGSRAGSRRSGFAYSPALKASGVVWDEETLDRWIENPTELIPGTRMAYAGLDDAERRRVLIAFLVSATRAE